MNNSHREKIDKATALLALGATHAPAAYDLPSDEELAALLENTLDDTRRAQIMDLIAHDAATFQRWMAVVEMAETLGIEAFASSAQTERAEQRAGTGIMAKIGDFLRDPFRGLATAGGSFATAAAVFLVFNGQPAYYDDVEGLYGDYGNQWEVMPVASIATRGSTRILAPELDIHDQALKEGVLDGLQALGPAFVLQGFSAAGQPSAAGDSLDDEQYQLYHVAGRVAVLSHFKCALEPGSDYYEKANSALLTLQAALNDYHDTTSAALNKAISRPGDAESRVCRFSKVVIDRVGG